MRSCQRALKHAFVSKAAPRRERYLIVRMRIVAREGGKSNLILGHCQSGRVLHAGGAKGVK
jgi:hypothetical protein